MLDSLKLRLKPKLLSRDPKTPKPQNPKTPNGYLIDFRWINIINFAVKSCKISIVHHLTFSRPLQIRSNLGHQQLWTFWSRREPSNFRANSLLSSDFGPTRAAFDRTSHSGLPWLSWSPEWRLKLLLPDLIKLSLYFLVSLRSLFALDVELCDLWLLPRSRAWILCLKTTQNTLQLLATAPMFWTNTSPGLIVAWYEKKHQTREPRFEF